MPTKPIGPCDLCEDPTTVARIPAGRHPGARYGEPYRLKGRLCEGCAAELDAEFALRHTQPPAPVKYPAARYRFVQNVGPPPTDIGRRIEHYAAMIAVEADPWESSPYRVGREGLR